MRDRRMTVEAIGGIALIGTLACGGAGDVAVVTPVCDAEHLDVCKTACDGGAGASCTVMLEAMLPKNATFDTVKDPATYKWAVEKGCTAGELRACQIQGNLYHNGALGLAVDDAKAVEFWTKGCDKGHGRSCLFLARAYEGGWSVKKSHDKSVELLDEACAGGEWEACSDVAWALTEQKKPDDKQAAELWKKGCDAGDLPSCRGLGWATENGRGVTKDEAAARALMQKACDGGVIWACGNLGYYLKQGMGGPQDEAKGKELLDKACKDGMAWSCEQLSGKKKKPAPVEEELWCGEFMTIPCDGQCVHFHEDENHCGGCGYVCPGGYYCNEGTCTPQ